MSHQPLTPRSVPTPALRTKAAAMTASAHRTQRDRVVASLIANPRLPGERSSRGRRGSI